MNINFQSASMNYDIDYYDGTKMFGGRDGMCNISRSGLRVFSHNNQPYHFKNVTLTGIFRE